MKLCCTLRQCSESGFTWQIDWFTQSLVLSVMRSARFNIHNLDLRHTMVWDWPARTADMRAVSPLSLVAFGSRPRSSRRCSWSGSDKMAFTNCEKSSWESRAENDKIKTSVAFACHVMSGYLVQSLGWHMVSQVTPPSIYLCTLILVDSPCVPQLYKR